MWPGYEGDTYDGIKFRTTVAGKRVLTPMLLVLISLAITDVIFAFDSIPAIFGITTSPFLVLVANVFALMGLRQLYFLLGGLIEKLEYLTYGIAAILAFIGIKLVLHALRDNTLPFINGGKHLDGIPGHICVIPIRPLVRDAIRREAEQTRLFQRFCRHDCKILTPCQAIMHKLSAFARECEE